MVLKKFDSVIKRNNLFNLAENLIVTQDLIKMKFEVL